MSILTIIGLIIFGTGFISGIVIEIVFSIKHQCTSARYYRNSTTRVGSIIVWGPLVACCIGVLLIIIGDLCT